MNSSFLVAKRFLVVLGIPLAIVVASGYAYFRASLPAPDLTLAADGAHGSIRIKRDEHGVPHITAANERDLFFAMGYAQAQDRGWQLEISKRFAEGRLSELLGRGALEGDILMRTLNLHEAAAQAWPALGADAKASLEAYAAGVNAWHDAGHVLPPEFLLTGTRPQKWTPVDSLAIIKVFALGLAGNYQGEIERYVAEQGLDASRLATFFPASATASSSVARSEAVKGLVALSKLNEAMRSDYAIGGRFVGSNAWAISGKLTKDGTSILANDPHLGLQIPSLWYPVQMNGGRLQVAGMAIVGLPVVVFGQNGKIAWGGTNMMADVQDLYVEQTDPANPTRYKAGTEWKDYAAREEMIDVRPDFPAFLRSKPEPVRVRVRASEHGPIISDVVDGIKEPLALAWVGLAPGDKTYESFLQLNYAADWTQFRAALKDYRAPALNLLYADTAGNIGYQGVGGIPQRALGHGQMPVPGWSGDYRWTGYIPFDQLPTVYNPPQGYIASANDNMAGPDYSYFISDNWAPRGRVDRIKQLITTHAQSGGLTLAQMQSMQADTVSLPARKMLAVLAGYAPRGQRQAQALDYLRRWDGNMSTDSVAATVFDAWMSAAKENLFTETLQLGWGEQDANVYADRLKERVSLDTLAGIFSAQSGPWCSNAPAAAGKQCSAVLDESLNDALDRLTKLAGSSMSSWKWGKLHQSVYSHVPFSQVNLLRNLFERRIGNGGSTDTINVANARYSMEKGYEQDLGAGFRQVMQLGPRGVNHQYMNSTGESGNIFSEHYADMISPFNRVEFYGLSTSSARPAGEGQ